MSGVTAGESLRQRSVGDRAVSGRISGSPDGFAQQSTIELAGATASG